MSEIIAPLYHLALSLRQLVVAVVPVAFALALAFALAMAFALAPLAAQTLTPTASVDGPCRPTVAPLDRRHTFDSHVGNGCGSVREHIPLPTHVGQE